MRDSLQSLAADSSDLWSVLWPQDATAFWTMVYAVATVALVILAWRGLRSLRLAKADMVTRAQRDALVCAMQRCEELARRLIPENGRILQELNKAKIPVFVKSADQVEFDPDPNQGDAYRRAAAWVSQLPGPVRIRSVRFLNDLEAWALFFVNRVADHETAFGPCAPAYCSMVVQNYALLIVLRSHPSSGKYPNAVGLFKSWHEKLEHQQRGMKEGDLLNQLAVLQARPPSQYPLDPPLGTKLDGL